MTGLNALEQELVLRGCTVQQSRAKAVQVLLEIIAEKADDEQCRFVIQQYKDAIKALEQERYDLNHRIRIEEASLRERAFLVAQRERTVKRLEEEANKAKENAENMMQAETAEARDMIRRFLVFKDNIEINTVYDNTAFIYSAGKILSGSAATGDDFEIQKTLDEAKEKGDSAKKYRRKV